MPAGGGQLGLYRGALVVGTGPQGQIEPGVIIEAPSADGSARDSGQSAF